MTSLLAISRPLDPPAAAALDDERVLVRLAARDPEAYGRLYRLHYAAVAGYLYRRTGDRDLAEDLASETFLSAYRSIGRYRWTGAPISSWFMRIATNKANAWARRRRSSPMPPTPLTLEPGEDAEQRERLESLYRALHGLKPEHQAVIALVRFESLSHEHAALALGVRPGTVKSRLARATDELRRKLTERHGDLP